MRPIALHARDRSPLANRGGDKSLGPAGLTFLKLQQHIVSRLLGSELRHLRRSARPVSWPLAPMSGASFGCETQRWTVRRRGDALPGSSPAAVTPSSRTAAVGSFGWKTFPVESIEMIEILVAHDETADTRSRAVLGAARVALARR